MARIVLGVTGSVAAIRTPELFLTLRAAGHDVRIVATDAALYFFDRSEIDGQTPPSDALLPARFLFLNRDEWPGDRYRRDDPILHIELRRWADLLIVAPLDANSLAKFALGLSDNLLSCLYRAWDFAKPVILAPAMNTRMWVSPVTVRHLSQILADRSGSSATDRHELDDLPALFASRTSGIILISPQSKRLACGDVGVGAMAEVSTISAIVQTWASQFDEQAL